MRKLLLALAFCAAMAFATPVAADHVKVGEPISVVQLCRKAEDAPQMMHLLIKAVNAETMQAYLDFIGSRDNTCVDVRAMPGTKSVVVVPQERLPDYQFETRTGVFTLWKVKWEEDMYYAWEGEVKDPQA
jgi:hypothetical protein